MTVFGRRTSKGGLGTLKHPCSADSGARKSHCVKAASGSRWRIGATPHFAGEFQRVRAANVGLRPHCAQHRPPPALKTTSPSTTSRIRAATPAAALAPQARPSAPASSPRSRRCARMRSMSSDSSMLAITSKRPPQRTHCSSVLRRATCRSHDILGRNLE